MIAFDDQWPYEQFNGDYIAFLNSMTKAERIAWRVRTDKERNSNMAATRRGRPAKATQAQQLLEALDFVKVATGELMPIHSYVSLNGNMLVAFNGQITAGHPIVEQLTLCPQLERFEAALKRCGKSLVISETPLGQLSIKGDKLRALVPCLKDSSELYLPQPDANIAPVDDRLKEAFKVCGKLASEAGDNVMTASLLLEANQCSGTNRVAILQYWHGIDLPPHMVLPKSFAAAVASYSKPLIGFGFSWRDNIVATVTFYFEGGAWIKTQCYSDRWQDISRVLDCNSFPAEVPGGLFDAIEAVAEFSEDGNVVFADNQVMSHTDTGVGAQWEVKGLQGGKTFKGKLVKLVAPYVGKIDLATYQDRAYFFAAEGTPVRGAIIGFTTQITYRDTVEADAPGEFDQSAESDDSEAEGNQEGWGGTS